MCNSYPHKNNQCPTKHIKVAGVGEHTMISKDLNLYMDILSNFYNMNFLKLNQEKTKYFIQCSKNKQNLIKNITFKYKANTIKPVKNIRVLGIILNDQNNFSSHVNEVVRTINYKLVNLNLLKKYNVNIDTKKTFLNGFLVGKLNYGLPILINARKH